VTQASGSKGLPRRTFEKKEDEAHALLRATEPMEVDNSTSNKRMPAEGNTEGKIRPPSPSKPAGKKRRKAEPVRGKPDAASVRKDQSGQRGGD